MNNTKWLEHGSFIAFVAAAALWFLSASITVQFGAYGGMPETEKRKLRIQGRLNQLAAALTGAGALLQAFSHSC